jgi:hypothetical protein
MARPHYKWKSKTLALRFYKSEVPLFPSVDMRGQTHLQQHLPEKTLLDAAEETVRLTGVEVDHLDRCSECFTRYAKSIVHAARKRATEKCQKRSIITQR